jgi:OmpA-OmpF porin, OOP family
MITEIKYFIICSFCLLISKEITAQNLIANGSFEDTSACIQNPPPWFPYCSGACYAPPWFQPTFGSVDYFNYYYSDLCGGGGNYVVNYYNLSSTGYQLPHSGDGMMGIVGMNAAPEYREYLQYPLTNSLIAGHVYNVSFKASLSNHSRIAIGKLGVYFSPDSMLELTDFQGVIPQVISTPGISLSDTLNWMTINGNFTSNGTENFLTIGNFYPDALSDSITVVPESFIPGAFNLAYYYIDDVFIFDTTVGISEPTNIDFDISPNPTNGVFNLNIPAIDEIQIQIFNRIGQIVMELNLKKPTKTISINLSQFPDGLYFIKLTSQNWSTTKKALKVKE